jgi:hypothetical protein
MVHETHLFPEGSGYRGLASLTRREDLRGCERIRVDSIWVTAFTDLPLYNNGSTKRFSSP